MPALKISFCATNFANKVLPRSQGVLRAAVHPAMELSVQVGTQMDIASHAAKVLIVRADCSGRV